MITFLGMFLFRHNILRKLSHSLLSKNLGVCGAERERTKKLAWLGGQYRSRKAAAKQS